METKLIESALQLTGKTIEDMNIPKYLWDCNVNWMAFPEFWDEFSIEKLCYYLLSPEFIDKYTDYVSNKCKQWEWISIDYSIDAFWIAIYEYQSWNEERLISLLPKIWPKE